MIYVDESSSIDKLGAMIKIDGEFNLGEEEFKIGKYLQTINTKSTKYLIQVRD